MSVNPLMGMVCTPQKCAARPAPAVELKETEIREATAGYERRLAVSFSEKVASMSEDELLQHVLAIFQQEIPWGDLGRD